MSTSSRIPTTAAELLLELRRRGAEIEVDGGRLRIRAPRGVLTGPIRSALEERKDEILRLLSPGEDARPRCRSCGAELQHASLDYCLECAWDEARAERMLKATLDRCAEAYERAGPPYPPLPDLEPLHREIDAAFERQDMRALKRALARYEAAVKEACAAVGGDRG